MVFEWFFRLSLIIALGAFAVGQPEWGILLLLLTPLVRLCDCLVHFLQERLFWYGGMTLFILVLVGSTLKVGLTYLVW